ncbi:hypothetical protein CC86DRAFT_404579 [Ophiobolus disseminans]|uniref:Uncharacterized protein n=1 Tax=Ophiobolus disseminans TaxID=1469910 RepID=A0A6A7A5V3_9PLEO|nr:hypothetical protein CC86DRAFT_404579 [Ophiobolus disseminans]
MSNIHTTYNGLNDQTPDSHASTSSQPPRTEDAPRQLLKHLLLLTSTKSETNRRDIINNLNDAQLDNLVGSLWEQGISRKVRERVRLDLDYFRPRLDADDREWLLGSFTKLNEAVGQLWQRKNDDLKGGWWTRVNVLEMLLDDYVLQDRRDRRAFVQRAAAEKGVTRPAAKQIMSRCAGLSEREVEEMKVLRLRPRPPPPSRRRGGFDEMEM